MVSISASVSGFLGVSNDLSTCTNTYKYLHTCIYIYTRYIYSYIGSFGVSNNLGTCTYVCVHTSTYMYHIRGYMYHIRGYVFVSNDLSTCTHVCRHIRRYTCIFIFVRIHAYMFLWRRGYLPLMSDTAAPSRIFLFSTFHFFFAILYSVALLSRC